MKFSQPITFPSSGKKARNRLYRTAVSEYACTYDEMNPQNCGRPLPRYVQLYKDIAEGGAGLICLGNIPIDREYIESKGNAILDARNPWDPVAGFTPAIAAAKSKGAICLAQLQHPGRQCPASINPRPKSASDVLLKPCFNKSYGQPSPLTHAEIKAIVEKYVWASRIMAEAGADGIMLHGCHGYLITQFLSPRTNKRKDEYGGSLENRARFVLEIVNAIKAQFPSHGFLIAIKFNCQDFTDGGMSFAESCVVMKWLEDAGVEFFDISGGTYFVEWAKEMKKLASRAVVGTSGGWRDPVHMAESIQAGEVDMCGLGRPIMMRPDFVNRVLQSQAKLGSKL